LLLAGRHFFNDLHHHRIAHHAGAAVFKHRAVAAGLVQAAAVADHLRRGGDLPGADWSGVADVHRWGIVQGAAAQDGGGQQPNMGWTKRQRGKASHGACSKIKELFALISCF